MEEHLGRKYATLENLSPTPTRIWSWANASVWSRLQSLGTLGQACGLGTASWLIPQMFAILSLIPPETTIRTKLTVVDGTEHNTRLAREVSGMPVFPDAVCADVARWHGSAEVRVLRVCLFEILAEHLEQLGPPLWLAGSVCLV